MIKEEEEKALIVCETLSIKSKFLKELGYSTTQMDNCIREIEYCITESIGRRMAQKLLDERKK
jgi:hypothetical protein